MNAHADNLCLRLDEFLDGELSPSEFDAFASHLERCEACRDPADQQRWIDGLLRSETAAELEAAPVAQTIPGSGSRRRRAVVAAAAAAAVIATAALLLPLPRREGLGEGRPTVVETPRFESHAGTDQLADVEGSDAGEGAAVANPSPSPSPSLRGRGTSAAAFVSVGSSIAVPVASADPQVTVVQLYPTVTATRRWAREAALRAIALPPNGG